MISALAGVSHSRAMQAIAVAVRDPLAAQVISGKLSLSEAFAKVQA